MAEVPASRRLVVQANGSPASYRGMVVPSGPAMLPGAVASPPGPAPMVAGAGQANEPIGPHNLPPGYEPRPVVSKRDIHRTVMAPGEGLEPTYWTMNRWGAPGRPNQSLGKKVLTPEAKRANKHYQRPTNHIKQPDAAVFNTLNDLEALMRATLGALANFNEDERMILTRQFRKEEERAQARGEYSPPGLLNVEQFRHAFKKFSIRVTEEQAAAMFIKYGSDSQGLLPYDMFVAKLLSSPARMLALEPEQKGAYKAGKDASFRGKILYRYCRKPVFPPSNWDGSLALRSARKPKAGLKLEFVYGYAGKDNTTNNLFYTADNKIVYYVAALGIVYDPATHTQTFYQAHDDDIRCMALHPDRYLVATGQVASALDGSADVPYLTVWDTRDVLGVVTKIKFPSDGQPARYVVAMAFSGDGKRLVVVTGDNRHSVYVYHWRSKELIYQDVGHNGQPPQVYGVVWNNFLKERDAKGDEVVIPAMFVTHGVKHMKIWTLARDQRTNKEIYTTQQGRFGRAQVGDVLSAAFVSADTLVTGTQSGELLVWDMGGRRGGFGCCIQVVPAHGPGVRAPSIHDGQPVLQGVRAMCLRANNTELATGGSDGVIICWDITQGTLGRVIKTVQLQEVGESTPCSFRSLDNRPGSYDLVAGTNRCEVWEVARETPEPLLQGHTDDVYGAAWHPKKPYKFASACDSSNVFLWNAKRRQLIAKVNIGAPARSVAFSPNGAHLAVGTYSGMIKVLQVDNLTQKVAEMHFAKEDIEELKYSPDGTKLASGSHDNFIDIYDVTRGYQRIGRCSGHSSYVKHIDWSLDSRIIQSNCGAYELLYFEAATGKQVRQNQRDTLFDTWTCSLGFPVMGVWQNYSDGTDINSVCRSFKLPNFQDSDPLVGEGEYVVTASDDGRVRIFNYPCVVDDAPHRAYIAHCSHVMEVRFSPNNRWVISVGGKDRSAMQWRVLAEAADEIIVDKPQIEVYQVYQAPVRPEVAPDPLALMPGPGGVAPVVPPPLAPGEEMKAALEAEAKRKEELDKLRKQDMQTYEITTVTTDIKGAGTDSRVFMNVYGDKRASGELKLENSPENFARGATDKFLFELQDLGAVNRLVVGHHADGKCPRWHLDKVIITNKSQPGAPPLVFPCSQWFAKDIGDGQTVRTLKLGASGPTTKVYKVVVKTSDVRGAGTDANVYLTLYGEAGGQALNSGSRRLENSANNFERGQTDVFEVEASVGDLKYIKIGHDNSGLGPSWHLQEVMISCPGSSDKQFVANRWLALNEGDGKTYVELYPSDVKDVPQPHKYKIMVYTSDIRGAGTDANVTIILFGTNNKDTGKIKLDNSKNNFERGQEDVFFTEARGLGDISEVEIEHDNSGPSPGWHCEQVVVVNETTGKRYSFPCDRWLATDEDDRMIRRRLKCMQANGETTAYRISTYTSDMRGAGTDANVFIELCGTRDGKEVWGPRMTLDSSKNNFERGEIDTFLFKKHKNLGDLTKIKIGHDNSGAGPGWHLDHVEIVDDGAGKDYYFPCNRWFDKKEDDGALERILEAAKRDPKAEKGQYKITVHTSDIKFAGTDANVHIQLIGERDGQPTNSGPQPLNNSKNNFERAAVDVFNLTLPNIGELKRIIIGHDNSNPGADWHLNMVEVLCANTGQHARFYYGNWLSKDEPPYKLEVELFPVDGDKPPMCRYSVITYTSDLRGAGTDANVSCMIIGDKASTPLSRLENSKNNFERGQRDEFVIESVDVGHIQKLQIGHDDSGLGAAWHLSHVEVVHQATGDRYYFLADQWLDKKQGTLTITLEPTNAAGAKQVYKVSIQTSDKRGAGTDADISVILIGAKGTSKEIKLESSADNFERNKLDEFKLDVGQADLGEIQKVDIGFANEQSIGGKLGGLFGQQWGLQSVEVLHFNTNDRKFFFYDDWISDKKRRVQLMPGKVGENNTYKIVVRTSDIRGAGTDANVTCCIFGEKDGRMVDTGTHKLDNSANNFERNAVDTFVIKCKDVGELRRCVITSDGSGLGASWHLDQVEVTDTVRGVSVVFPCGEWLDPSEAASLQKTLLPRGVDGEKGSLLQYEVTVYTSDLRGAGTDSNVSIEIWGDKDHTPPTNLETAANNFERGAKDLFNVKATDVGEIQHVIIRKDNKGLGGDWHLQSVEVWHPALKKRYFFLCNDWFKGVSERKLEAGKVPENGRCTYRVLVTTSDQRGAGTDANVSMTLFGAKGDTGERKLDTSANNFERGQVDTFFFEAPDVGTFNSLRIGHDNSGFGASWHLAKVEVVNTNTGEQAVFPCNRWLDKEQGLSVLLTPDRDGDGQGDALVEGAMAEYTISVYTSDVRGAGTDANVFIEMYGDKGSVGQTRLDNNANNFERGIKDVFKVRATNVGDVQKVIIWHDNAGPSPDWHLQQVEVFNPTTSKTYFFPCNAWLKKDGTDLAGCRKELTAGNPDAAGPTNYRVAVYTSDMRGAGTDADVYLVIYGDKGDSGERKLDNSKNNFERGAVDTFFLTSPNVGAMQKIKLRSSGGGLGAAWHLQKVEITSSATGETLVFPFNKWMDKENGLEHVLWPDRDGDGTGDVGGDAALVKYRVGVYTSDVRGAGTDANVTLEIHGDKAFVGAQRLDNATNNFERGRKDEFEVSGTDVGEITHIVIAHDNAGLSASWHLSQVELYHPVLQKTYTFPCDEWLEFTKEEGIEGCKRTLKTGAAAAADGLVTYRVLVKTSDTRGAGTDSDVFITIFGPKGDTGERQLDNSKNNFERNQLDTFILKGPDVGDIERIAIRSSGSGLGSSWHLQQVDILSSATNASYHFPFNGWVDDKNGLEHVIWKDGVQGTATPTVDYRVNVYTSDIRGAGTDANVYIEMFGDKGSVGQTRLETSANNFERGMLDTFVVKGTDIGDVQRVIIGHDDSGVGSAWHCQHVEVFNPSTQRSYFFPCNAWLEKTKELGAAGCRRELLPGVLDVQEQCSYKIEVKTSDLRGAGTDANVEMCVFGSKGDTGMRKLDDSRNNFERNMLDTFFIKGPDIGGMTSCKVVCDGTGLGAEWHLDYVAVTNTTTAAYAKFVYTNWFDAKNGWTQTLVPEGKTAADANLVDYQITVLTSDVRGAGTDGDVFISMKGDTGAMGETKLPGQRSSFERNQTDVFTITGSDIGAVKEITVRLEEAGVGAAWHFQQIEVMNKRTGAKALFVYNNWLEKTKDNPKAAVTLQEASSETARAVATKHQWRVTTQTGTMFGAGTDAPVWVQIWGPVGMLGLGEIFLDNSRNNFERSKIDVFTLEFPAEQDCGAPVHKIVVERGKSATLGADWFLEWIELVDLSRGHTYKWRCGRWFSDKEGLKHEWSSGVAATGEPQALELIEAPGGVEPSVGAPSVSGDAYRVVVHTSDKFGAGTDATVKLEFTDAQGNKWQPSLPQEKRMFERGSADEFSVSSLMPLEELVQCRAWLEHSGLVGDAWHLDKVVATHLPSQRAWEFGLKDWVPKQGAQMAAKVINDVPLRPPPPTPAAAAGKDAAGAPQQDDDVHQGSDQQQQEEEAAAAAGPPPPPAIEYEVIVSTGDKYGAGTDAIISMELQGSNYTALHTFDRAKMLFERDANDRFIVRVPDCGDLSAIKVWHDGSGFGADWYLAKISVEPLQYNCKYEAVFNSWIKGGEDKAVTRPLNLVSGEPPSSRPPPPPPRPAAAPPAALQPQDGKRQPGDPGIEPRVLDEAQFRALPAMQAGRQDDTRRISRDTAIRPEPVCAWQKFSVPYAKDLRYTVTYYHNTATGESTYDKPKEYEQWEAQYHEWLQATLGVGVGGGRQYF